MEPKIKVLMIAECPRNFQEIKGGLEAASVNLILGFKNLQIDLRVISIRKDLEEDAIVEIAENIHVHYHKFTHKGSKIFEFLIFGKRKIRDLVNKFNPDITHLQGTGPIMLMLRGIDKKKIVVTQHGIIQEELKYKVGLKQNLKFLVKSYFEKILIKKFQNYISISHYNRGFLLEMVGRKRLLHTEVIYNAVNPKFFEASVSPRANRLIFVGLVNKLKGVHILVEAIAELKRQGMNFTLDVIGGSKEPVYLESIKKLIMDRDLEKSVTLHGWKNQEEVSSLLSENSIFILPSLQECLPICIAEAMAAGLLVIATNTGGIPEMFKDKESGFLLVKNDVPDLVQKLTYLYNNFTEVDIITANAKKEAYQKYNPISVAEQTLHYYKSLLAS